MLDQWLVWQLADAAFPAGGFAHSGGVEAVARWGLVRDSAQLEQLLQDQLTQTAHGAIPLLAAVHRTPARFAEVDRLANALLCNHVANRASRAQGKSLLMAAQAAFDRPAITDLAEQVRRDRLTAHLAPIFGAITQCLEVKSEKAVRLFLHITLRGLLSSSVRLGVVGPLEAQSIQFRLGPFAENLAERSLQIDLDGVAQTAPLLDLLQAAHDRLYSRLFQS